MPHPLRLRAHILATLITGPEAQVLALLHAEQFELLVGPQTAHHPIVDSSDHVVALAAWEVRFVHGDFDYVGIAGGCEGRLGGLEIFTGEVSKGGMGNEEEGTYVLYSGFLGVRVDSDLAEKSEDTEKR